MPHLQQQFSAPLLAWYDLYGRKDLPWQQPKHPYRVWVSEIMLQQTQVQTVIPYFNRFMTHFPTVQVLAQASEDAVLALWSGLGYYSRARNLHQTAKIITTDYNGIMPSALEQLIAFPGIGPSTAAAILSQAYNLPTAILDGNVKRVLTRFFRIEGWPEQAGIKKTLWERAKQCMPVQRCADYTQAIMDLGATCCTLKKPKCSECPIQTHCLANLHNEQQLYPTKRIKKAVPVQQQQFLVLIDENQHIFLEKKPPVGIWGGLWCLPSLDKSACSLTYVKKNYNLSVKNSYSLMKLKHRFSHFHLEIDAIAIHITKSATKTLAEPQGQWFSKEKLTEVGIATPITKIFNYLFSQSGINKA